MNREEVEVRQSVDEEGYAACQACATSLQGCEEDIVQLNDFRMLLVPTQAGGPAAVLRRSHVGAQYARLRTDEEGFLPARGVFLHLTCVEMYLRGVAIEQSAKPWEAP